MDIYIRSLGEKRTLELFDYGSKKNIAKQFLEEIDFLKHFFFTEDGMASVGNEDSFVEWQETMQCKQENIDLFGAYSSRTGDQLSTSTVESIKKMYVNSLRRECSVTWAIQESAATERHILNTLINGTLVVSQPVNKKFWPLANTSHTFKIMDFEEIIDCDHGLWWRVLSSIDFNIVTPNPKYNIGTQVIAEHNIKLEDGKLKILYDNYEWDMPMTANQETAAREIIISAIHSDFTVRGINESFAA